MCLETVERVEEGIYIGIIGGLCGGEAAFVDAIIDCIIDYAHPTARPYIHSLRMATLGNHVRRRSLCFTGILPTEQAFA